MLCVRGRSPCCVPQRRVLPWFSSLLDAIAITWLTTWADWLYQTFGTRFRSQNERISLRAGRPAALVGCGGTLGMAFPATGRGVDRLGQRDAAAKEAARRGRRRRGWCAGAARGRVLLRLGDAPAQQIDLAAQRHDQAVDPLASKHRIELGALH